MNYTISNLLRIKEEQYFRNNKNINQKYCVSKHLYDYPINDYGHIDLVTAEAMTKWRNKREI